MCKILKMTNLTCLLWLIILCCNAVEQDRLRTEWLNQPESITYDAVHHRYLVSNWGDGKIIAIDSLNEQTVFNTELSSVAGIQIRNDKLFCCDRNGLGIIDLNTALLDTLIHVPGDSLLNDLVFADQFVYISDYWDPKIYRMNLEDYTCEVFVQQPQFVPNGLFYDEQNDRILCVARNTNGASPRVMAIDPHSGQLSLVINTPYYSLDGITRDNDGNWYLSSWYINSSTQGVFKYPPDFSGNPEIITTDCNGPADICFSNDVLAVPNLNANSVLFLPMETDNQDIAILSSDMVFMQNYPNPFNPNTFICFELNKTMNVELSIFNIKGQKVDTLIKQILPTGKHKINYSADKLNSGIYFCRLKTQGSVKVIKMMLIK